MNEFELIARFFTPKAKNPSTLLSIGDDCALLKTQKSLAVSTDTLVADAHFFKNTDPYRLGQKALAINLSDLAAMGAKPLAFLLALTLPSIDEDWLGHFSRGLLDMADDYQIDLVGGNIARGPLAINITVMGEVALDQALRRDKAQVDDDIYVTGVLGGAALALQALKDQVKLNAEILSEAQARLETPIPRVHLAQDLIGVAHAAIDLSDGLYQDLNHILDASHVGAKVQSALIPVFPGANLELAFGGGEDYELCFTAAAHQRGQIQSLSLKHDIPITRIGVIRIGSDLEVLNTQGELIHLHHFGYQHFRN